jgi:hypothetical protein
MPGIKNEMVRSLFTQSAAYSRDIDRFDGG